MKYIRKNEKIFLRIDKGEEIIESIKAVLDKENVLCGSVSGIGATDNFEVGIFNLETKKYDSFSFSDNHEINCLCGNITAFENKPYIHLHITCTGKGCNVVGGHLLKAIISVTSEIVIDIIDISIKREHNAELNFNQVKF